MARPDLDRALTVAQLLRQRPAAVAVFVRRGMSCPGCSMAPFETLLEVAAVYGQEPGGFLAEVAAAAGGAPDSLAETNPEGRRSPEKPPKRRA